MRRRFWISRFSLRKFGLVVSLALAFLLAIPTVAFASSNSGNHLTPGTAHVVGVVNVAGLPLARGTLAARTLSVLAPSAAASSSNAGPQASLATSSGSGVSVGLTLNGVFGGAPNPCGCTPPDTNVGVGPRHVFEMVNIAGIIYLKDGTIAKNTFSLGQLFQVSDSALIGDPEVMFDATSGRWFVSSIIAPNNVEFGVSTSDDPTGTFVLYTVLGGSIFPDQPFIGTNVDKFVISVNAFTNHFLGAEFWVFNKAELVNGSSSIDFVVVGPNPALFSAHPARHLTGSTTFYLVSVAFGSATSASLLAVTGVPPGATSVTLSSFAVSPISNPPKATQPTTGTKLNPRRGRSSTLTMIGS